MSYKATQSVLVNVARKGGGKMSEDRAAIRDQRDGEFWPNVGKSWTKFYRTLNSKFYAERLNGNEVHMSTHYAQCEDQDYVASLHDSCKVRLDDGSIVVKIIKIA